LSSSRFPSLVNYVVTSPETGLYNCIAWALGDNTRWWWPTRRRGVYWPDGIRCDNSIEAFDDFFSLGGAIITNDASLEAGFAKVALFADGLNPTHAARQLPNGAWTSKLGSSIDISHNVLDLEGPAYGQIVRIYKVAITS
jgi:hypothetical protein